jgi:hypothetical protein
LPNRRPFDASLAPIALLLPVGLLELAINRLAVPLLRPGRGAPPLWHTALDYSGLFLFYFASLLGIAAIGLRALRAIESAPDRRQRGLVSVAPLLLLAVLSAWALLGAPSQSLTFAMEVAFAVAVASAVVRGFGHFTRRRRDLGIVVGTVILAAPLMLHFVAALGGRYWWSQDMYDGAGAQMARIGALALAIAGLASPYCLAPRPFVRAVTKVAPVVVAILVAVIAAMLLRHDYLGTARAVKLAIGIELQTTRADPQLTLYLLAVATMSWTIASCALAATGPRRAVACALGLLLLGGYGFQWPLQYLFLALGIISIADAAVPVKAAERSSVIEAPAVDDATWGRYLGAISTALRRRCATLHSLTTRASDGTTSSVLVGEADGRSIRARIDRDLGVVIGLDIVIGRDLDLSANQAATLTVVCDDLHLAQDAPTVTPPIVSGDALFDRRFRCHGAAGELQQLFDAGARDRALGLFDGWFAYARGQSLRYRTYPGRGAAVDHLIPMADLAQGHVPNGAGERVVVIVDLLLELAARGEVVGGNELAGISSDGNTMDVGATGTSTGVDR